MGLDRLLQNLEKVPEALRMLVRNGGEIFFLDLTHHGSGPSGIVCTHRPGPGGIARNSLDWVCRTSLLTQLKPLQTGGGFVNHILFFNSFTTNGTEIDPKSDLHNAITKVCSS
jgi:hypothetical protein